MTLMNGKKAILCVVGPSESLRLDVFSALAALMDKVALYDPDLKFPFKGNTVFI